MNQSGKVHNIPTQSTKQLREKNTVMLQDKPIKQKPGAKGKREVSVGVRWAEFQFSCINLGILLPIPSLISFFQCHLLIIIPIVSCRCDLRISSLENQIRPVA